MKEGEEMVGEEMVNKAYAEARVTFRSVHHRTLRAVVRRVLTAVAPDIAAQAKRECSEELRRLLRTPGKGLAHIDALADHWSGSDEFTRSTP